MRSYLINNSIETRISCSSVYLPIPSLCTGDWREQLHPLVTRLNECVIEVVEKAKRAMTFVVLQEAACSIPQGFLLQQRRDVVFSQAVGVHTEMTNNSFKVHSNLPVLAHLWISSFAKSLMFEYLYALCLRHFYF